MEDVKTGIVGVQLTLVGLFLVTIFEGVYPYPLVGLLLGAVGTSVVAVTVFGL